MKSKLWAILALGAACTLGGCTSVGTNFSQASVDALQPGISTRADAERALGRPNSVTNLPDGTVLLQWVHAQTVLISSQSKHVALIFDADGKFVEIFSQTQTIM